MASSKATVRVHLVCTRNVETRHPLDQVQNHQHHNYSLLRDQPEPVLGDVLLYTSQRTLWDGEYGTNTSCVVTVYSSAFAGTQWNEM